MDCLIFPVFMSAEMANISTKPSSRDNGLVDILSISTNMLHKPDGPRFDTGDCYVRDFNRVMTLMLRALEATDVVCIVGSGIPAVNTSGLRYLLYSVA